MYIHIYISFTVYNVNSILFAPQAEPQAVPRGSMRGLFLDGSASVQTR